MSFLEQIEEKTAFMAEFLKPYGLKIRPSWVKQGFLFSDWTIRGADESDYAEARTVVRINPFGMTLTLNKDMEYDQSPIGSLATALHMRYGINVTMATEGNQDGPI